jgi:hypothetical protein
VAADLERYPLERGSGMVKQFMRPHLPHVPKHCPLPLTIDEIVGAETQKANPVRSRALLERCLESVGEG